MMHDKTLRRTTNIEEVFPDRVDEPVYMFNISDINKLNAGKWFLDVSRSALLEVILFNFLLYLNDWRHVDTNIFFLSL